MKNNPSQAISRRKWLGVAATTTLLAGAAPQKKASIAITLDLEMSRNFPTWETTHWDYEKGNLNEESKRYSVKAAEMVREAGGRIHFFAVGRVLEQPDIQWLKTLVANGHPVGNHTYDHINLTATKVEELQFRFERSPWLLRNQTLLEAIRENIQLTNAAMKARRGKWLDTKEPTAETKGAFKKGEWNSYQILAKGNRIQTWVNGIEIADMTDSEDTKGFIGLQVHGIGKGTGPYEVSWRKLRIRDLD